MESVPPDDMAQTFRDIAKRNHFFERGSQTNHWKISIIGLNELAKMSRATAAPGTIQQRVPAINNDEAIGDDGKLLIPASVWKMYKETIDALNGNIRTLAAGGLRATVEAICLDNKVEGSLQKKLMN